MSDLRIKIAVALVRYSAMTLDLSYAIYSIGHPDVARRIGRHSGRWSLFLARKIHKEAAVTEMIEQSWWG